MCYGSFPLSILVFSISLFSNFRVLHFLILSHTNDPIQHWPVSPNATDVLPISLLPYTLYSLYPAYLGHGRERVYMVACAKLPYVVDVTVVAVVGHRAIPQDIWGCGRLQRYRRDLAQPVVGLVCCAFFRACMHFHTINPAQKPPTNTFPAPAPALPQSPKTIDMSTHVGVLRFRSSGYNSDTSRVTTCERCVLVMENGSVVFALSLPLSCGRRADINFGFWNRKKILSFP